MARYILALSISSEFYREYHEDGHSEEELLRQIQGELEDQIAEHDLPRLMERMLSSEGELDIPIFIDSAEPVTGRPPYLPVRN